MFNLLKKTKQNNPNKAIFWLGLWCITLQCTSDAPTTPIPSETIALTQLQSFPIEKPAKKKVKRTGIAKYAEKLPLTYNKTNLANFSLPHISQQLSFALEQQLVLLKRRKQNYAQDFDNLSLTLTDLETTIKLLLLWQQTFPQGLEEHLNAYQLKGEDGKGNVKFTGYFTPEINVSKEKVGSYKYPIYAFPEDWEGVLPTREEIDGEQHVLDGKGLEIAYAQRLEDIYYMQLQGSGLVKYRNGKNAYLGFAASNRHPYSSIEKYIKDNEAIRLKNISIKGIKNYFKHNPDKVEPILFTNPSYVFFEESNKNPLGAGHVPLTEDYSIAVDIRHLPLGSCLLAALPVIDDEGYFSHHEYKIVVAQDVGGVIRGNGHVDVYCGVGAEGQRKASALHHYGQLWLLLPKASNEVGPVFSTGAWVEK